MEAKINLKLLLDTTTQRVLFAEADQKAIDFLSHILTSPMPTVLKLLDVEPKLFGSIPNFFHMESYKTLLNLKTPIGYTCNGGHNYFSDDPNAASVCPECSKTMSVKMTYVAPPIAKVPGMYMVMDDLVVKPILSTVSALTSFGEFGVKADLATLEEKVVDLGLYEALELLRTSLSMSNEVLTTVFLKNARKENFKARVAGLCSNESTTYLKNMLSIDDINIPSIQEVVEAGVIPGLVESLERHDIPRLQSEATWLLQIIDCGTADHSKAVINHGAVPKLVKLLSSPSDDVREQALCALGNIAADSLESRKVVLSQGALAPLLAQLNDEHAELSTLRNATWALSKLCTDGLEYDQVSLALPVLKKLIMNSTDKEVLSEVCFTLSCLSDTTNDKIEAVIDSGVCPRLIQLLQHPSPDVLLYALETVGQIVYGNDFQVQYILDYPSTLNYLRELLRGKYSVEMKTEACRMISNITAGNRNQIWAVINSRISSALIYLLQNAWSHEIKEICGGSHSQVKCFVRQGCIDPLCELLVCPDPDIVTSCLRGLEKLVKLDPTEYAQMIIDSEGLEKLLKIENHDDSDICRMAKFIIFKISK